MAKRHVCAEALARCGDAAAVHVMIDMIDGLQRTRQNMDGILSLLVAVSVRCGPDHREWLRDQVPWRTDPVERWLILVGLARQGTTEDCRLVAEQVEAYLRKPTGPIRLMTGPIRLPHQTLFQAGMSFLHRMCPPQFAALAEQARVADLPPEDQQWLTSVLS